MVTVGVPSQNLTPIAGKPAHCGGGSCASCTASGNFHAAQSACRSIIAATSLRSGSAPARNASPRIHLATTLRQQARGYTSGDGMRPHGARIKRVEVGSRPKYWGEARCHGGVLAGIESHHLDGGADGRHGFARAVTRRIGDTQRARTEREIRLNQFSTSAAVLRLMRKIVDGHLHRALLRVNSGGRNEKSCSHERRASDTAHDRISGCRK